MGRARARVSEHRHVLRALDHSSEHFHWFPKTAALQNRRCGEELSLLAGKQEQCRLSREVFPKIDWTNASQRRARRQAAWQLKRRRSAVGSRAGRRAQGLCRTLHHLPFEQAAEWDE